MFNDMVKKELNLLLLCDKYAYMYSPYPPQPFVGIVSVITYHTDNKLIYRTSYDDSVFTTDLETMTADPILPLHMFCRQQKALTFNQLSVHYS